MRTGGAIWLFRAGLYRPEMRAALVPARALRMSGYAELQVTSNFSFLRGASHPAELVEQAKALGHRAIAITDSNTLAGIVRGHIAAGEQGMRFVVGCRLEVEVPAQKKSLLLSFRLISGHDRATDKAQPALLSDQPRGVWAADADADARQAARGEGAVHALL